jgi:hypothetical protein
MELMRKKLCNPITKRKINYKIVTQRSQISARPTFSRSVSEFDPVNEISLSN